MISLRAIFCWTYFLLSTIYICVRIYKFMNEHVGKALRIERQALVLG